MDADYKLLSVLRMPIIIKISSVAFAFLLQLQIAFELGVNQAGLYFYAISVATFSSVLCRLGQDAELLKYNAILGVSKLSNDCVLIQCLKRSFIAFFVLMFVFWHLELQMKLLVSILIVGITINALLSSHLKGLGHPNFAILLQSLIPSLLTVIALSLEEYALGREVLEVYVISTLIASILLICISVGYSKKNNCSADNIYELSYKRLLTFYALSIFNGITLWGGNIILGIFHSDSSVAYFHIMNKITGLMTVILSTLNSVVAPRISKIYQLYGAKQSKHFYFNLAKYMTFMAIMFAGFLSFFSPQILSLWGESYVFDLGVFYILILGHMINLAFGPTGYLLSMTGNETFLLKNSTLSIGLYMLTLVYLSINVGILGAAIATSLLYAFSNTINLVVFLKHEKAH